MLVLGNYPFEGSSPETPGVDRSVKQSSGGLFLLAAVFLAGTAGATVAGSLAVGRLRPVELLRED